MGEEKAPRVNNNLRTRPVDALLRQQKAPASQPPQPPPSQHAGHHGDSSMTLLRKLSRVAHPPPPRSALEAVIPAFREQREYGESTIASLENIIDPTTEQSNSNLTPAATPIKEEEDLDLGKPLTQLEKDRRQERLALENLNKRLQSTRTTIKDANRGLRRIENRIEEVEATNADTTAAKDALAPAKIPHTTTAKDASALAKTPQTTDDEAISFETIHNNNLKHTVCPHCGRGDSAWFTLWTEFRQNFYTYNTTNNRINLTWLGWTLFFWLLWLFLEIILSTQYSDYIYGPVFPFVTFNLSVRPFLPILKPFFTFLSWTFGSMFNLLFGEVAARSRSPRATPAVPNVITTRWGFDATKTTAFLSATASRVARSTVESLDEFDQLWHDDYIIT